MTRKNKTIQIISFTAYPVVISVGVVLHVLLLNSGCALQLSTYVPILLGALIITFLEIKLPYKKKWLANASDAKNDLTFIVVVQVLLPRFLSFLIAVTLLGHLKTKGVTLESHWPHGYPVLLQAICMVLLADFLRYWLHRASHKWYPLWRLHAVHHSPHKLYWVNVGRFHPIEEVLQFLFDALPFIVLGVADEVLALYFVFYAINGFFQHSNIELKLGFLNYVISGPELHRWHHSFIPREANNNYGNNLIIWDLLFGTRFLPKDKDIETLGLKNRNYPQDFIKQMRTPFIKGIDQG